MVPCSQWSRLAVRMASLPSSYEAPAPPWVVDVEQSR